MITHVVLFKLADASTENVQKTKDVLLNMEGKIEQLRYIEVGVDVLRSERSYDIALITKFDSLSDLDAYQVHPVHQQVVAHMKAVLASPSVCVDYES